MTSPAHVEPPADVQCPCGHPADQHDSLSARYCRATVVGGLDRGCMCVLAAAPLPR